MSLQYILDNCQNFQIDYRRVVNQMRTRSGSTYVSEYPTAQPYQITISMHNYLNYGANRAVIQALDNIDKNVEEVISFNNVNAPYLYNIVSYQGALTDAQLAALRISAVSGNTMTLTALPAIASTVRLFAAGDFIQPAGTRYNYKIKNDVLRGTGTTVTLSLHRPIVGMVPLNIGVNAGNRVTFPMLAQTMPVWRINPINLVEWSGDFVLFENVLGT